MDPPSGSSRVLANSLDQQGVYAPVFSPLFSRNRNEPPGIPPWNQNQNPQSSSRTIPQTPQHPFHPQVNFGQLPNAVASASHEELLPNRHYRSLFDQLLELQASHATLIGAYTLLANTIPQVFSVIPNVMGIPIPANSLGFSALPSSNAPPPPILSRTDYPLVCWWVSKDWKRHVDGAGDFVQIPKVSTSTKQKSARARSTDTLEDDDDDEEDDEDTKTSCDEDDDVDEKINVLGFLEDQHGRPLEVARRDYARKCTRELFQTFHRAKRAPPKFSQVDLEVMTYFRNNMVVKIPELALCENNWKVDALGTAVYSQSSKAKAASKSRRKEKRKADPLDSPDNKRQKIDKDPTHKSKPSASGTTPVPPDLTRLIAVSAWAANNNSTPPSVLNELPNAPSSSSPRLPESSSPSTNLSSFDGAASTTSHAISTSSPPSLNLRASSPPPDLSTDDSTPLSLPPLNTASTSDPKTSDTSTGISATMTNNLNNLTSSSSTASHGTNPSPPSLPAKNVAVANPLDGIFDGIVPAPSARLAAVREDKDNATASTSVTVPTTKDKKSTKHVPGTSDTAWNIFGREYMKLAADKKEKPLPTTEMVRAAYAALSESARKEYTDQALALKAASKSSKGLKGKQKAD
ncbi:hypothetical protein B0H11DRAFT_2225748 [Mycena galericulata]|nr:hypothetical protein B0H11DRAFT_2225748 [Mycena galericulata]